DKRYGQGTYTMHDGQQYIGAWQDGKPYGKCTWVFPDGKQYVGEWRDEKPSGRGTWILPDGTQYGGEWTAGPVAKVRGKEGPALPLWDRMGSGAVLMSITVVL